ncbi:MAG: hypothetical protein ACLGI3_21305, partial [Actinomycetes bacterium]
MSQAVDLRPDEVVAYHRLLLRMAGRLPDELVTEARDWLAAGDLVAIAQSVAVALIVGRVPAAGADLDLLTGTLRAAGADADLLGVVERSDEEPQLLYSMAPVAPEVLAEHRNSIPYSLDLTFPYTGPGALDRVDEAAIGPLAGTAATALWRTWRFGPMEAQWPPPRRVYLVQATDEVASPGLAVRLRQALSVAGENHAQVEVFTDADDLPAYQRTALCFSALLWTAEPAEPPRVSPVFDTFASGPGFAPDRPRLGTQEREWVMAYLDGGTPLVIMPHHTPDVLNPGRG